MTTMVNQDQQVQLLILIRTAIYVRVSTDKQEEDGTSLDTQVKNCLEYAKQNGLTVVAIYRETFTGALYRERPQLTKLRESYRKGELDAVLFNTFDRLSRNQIHLGVLIDEMEHYSIRIECVKEQFDNTATGQFMRNALAFVAQVEREKISYRTDTGRRERARNGKLIPGWKSRYGYIWADEEKHTMRSIPRRHRS
jgi:site-specific DNA recombinase